MKWIWAVPAIVVVLLFYFIAKKKEAPPRIDKLIPVQAGQQTCIGKRRCIVVFIAPWCEHCKASEPLIRRLLEDNRSNPKYFVNVVTSADEPAELKKHAALFGEGTFVDNGTTLASHLGLKSFPVWIFFDAEGKRIQKVSGSYGDKNRLLRELGLD